VANGYCPCGNISRQGQRDCLECHAAQMREFRRTHEMTDDQRRKGICRSYANVYKNRGVLVPEPCKCGCFDVEMHHDDYDKPLAVEWLCRPCHLDLHAEAA